MSHMSGRRLVAAVALTGLLAGCEDGSSSAGSPYRLYTHCGIEWTNIDGSFWQADHPLSDGSGNPPAGWGNPFQQGTLRLVNGTTAIFKSSEGSVTFHRTARTSPPFLCS
jgi:hypothetical protein